MYLFIDLEFTDLTDFNIPYYITKNYDKSRIVSLSYIISDPKCKNIIKEYHSVVKPDNFLIPDESIQFHNITNEFAHNNGKDIKEVFDEIYNDFNSCEYLMAYNIIADYNVLCSELFRYSHPLLSKVCSMKKVCVYEKTKYYFRKNISRPKSFKLIDVHKELVGNEFEYHNSLEDAKACYRVYQIIKK